MNDFYHTRTKTFGDMLVGNIFELTEFKQLPSSSPNSFRLACIKGDGYPFKVSSSNVFQADSVLTAIGDGNGSPLVSHNMTCYSKGLIVAEAVLKEQWKSLYNELTVKEPLLANINKYFRSQNFNKSALKFKKKVCDYVLQNIQCFNEYSSQSSIQFYFLYNHLNKNKLSFDIIRRESSEANLYLEDLRREDLFFSKRQDSFMTLSFTIKANNINANTFEEMINSLLDTFFTELVKFNNQYLDLISTMKGGFNYNYIEENYKD